MARIDTQDLVSSLSDFFRNRDEVRLAYLFGSRAAGLERGESDVDVAVLMDSPASGQGGWGGVMELASALSAHLGTDDLDVVDLGSAPPLLRHRVVSEGRELLVRDDREAVAFAERALTDYLDTAPLRAILASALRDLREHSRSP